MQASHACFGKPSLCVWEFVLMADLEAAETRLSFDDILEAVQDSKRGRWFLQEFETRLQKRDTRSVLDAISRLESRMENLGSQTSNPYEIGKVRNAIANARNDLIKLGLGKEALSKEGRIFHDMAELARKAMPVAVDSNAGIVRTLQLADEIESVFTPAANVDRGAKYFATDSNLFERQAALPKPVLVQQAEPTIPEPLIHVNAVKKDEPAPVGAKLVIRKANQAIEKPEPIIEAEPAPPVVSSAVAPDMPAIDNPRIVIIRRKAEDMPEVNLGEPAEEASAA
jgi:hypothetical protein